MIVQHWRAKNDTNGNPRRLFVVFDDRGSIVAAIDEEYSGEPKEIRGFVHLPEMNITPTEYRQALKLYRADTERFLADLRINREV